MRTEVNQTDPKWVDFLTGYVYRSEQFYRKAFITILPDMSILTSYQLGKNCHKSEFLRHFLGSPVHSGNLLSLSWKKLDHTHCQCSLLSKNSMWTSLDWKKNANVIQALIAIDRIAIIDTYMDQYCKSDWLFLHPRHIESLEQCRFLWYSLWSFL